MSGFTTDKHSFGYYPPCSVSKAMPNDWIPGALSRAMSRQASSGERDTGSTYEDMATECSHTYTRILNIVQTWISHDLCTTKKMSKCHQTLSLAPPILVF